MYADDAPAMVSQEACPEETGVGTDRLRSNSKTPSKVFSQGLKAWKSLFAKAHVVSNFVGDSDFELTKMNEGPLLEHQSLRPLESRRGFRPDHA